MAADTQVRLRVAYGNPIFLPKQKGWVCVPLAFLSMLGRSKPIHSNGRPPLPMRPGFSVLARITELRLSALNLGGGLPAHYREPVPPLAAYAEAIEKGLTKEFGARPPGHHGGTGPLPGWSAGLAAIRKPRRFSLKELADGAYYLAPQPGSIPERRKSDT